MDQFVERMARLSPEKRALLMRRLGEKAAAEAIGARTSGSAKPLSFAQQRLWFVDQIEPGGAHYNNIGAFRMSGELELGVFVAAINEIIRRHEVLRTTFVMRDGGPIQAVHSELKIAAPVIDLGRLDAERREEEARRLVDEEALRPFDLTKGPLLRTLVLDLGAHPVTGQREYVVTFTLHHIVSDGWSTDILIREFVALYEAFVAGRSSPLPDLAIQYADYAAWQRDWLQGEVLERQLDYWRDRLADAPSALDLPTDRPRPPALDHGGTTYRFGVSKELADRLRSLGRRQGATLFMVLLAGFQLLLSRHSGQRDICVGTPIANRRRAELEGLIGFFVNTLVLRADLSGDPTFLAFLAQTRETALGAQEHQDLPFERLVEELQPARDNRSALFQAMFVLQNAPTRELALPGLRVEPVALEGRTAKFDLTLALEEGDDGLIASFEYATALFDAQTIARMADHYVNLLEGIVADPHSRVSRLPMLSDDERRRLLVEWNDTAAAYPRDEPIHDLFEEQVARMPEAVAVAFGGDRLTYGELNVKANRLAHRLCRLGVGPETVVGICVERSLEMIVALLGVLKAGGAYLPLDPDYPSERLAYMIDDASPALALTQRSLRERLPDTVETLCLDTDWASIEGESEANPVSRATAQNLAYVIYTSGSTGRPKGALIVHRNAVAMLHWAKGLFGDERIEGLAAATSLSFDLSVFEIFLPLCRGIKLFVLKDITELGRFERHDGILINTVPSVMAELLRLDRVPASARIINLAGEPLPRSLARTLNHRRGVEAVFNLYGPSECTTYSSFAVLDKNDRRNPPIGRPISNTQIYLLDAGLEPVPAGVAGELYIGGAGLARGYLGRPDLTAERFVPNPFGDTGERLYRTGDLARYRADGDIEFLGRIDHQVKVRGFRIELGEVEAALSGVESVREAVAVAREDASGDKRLVAYVVGRVGADASVAELRAALQRELPDYMVPSAFVVLDALPLTKNGKVDRKALPAPDVEAQIACAYVAPRTPVEETLCRIWADVLGLERVGIDDDFFEFGGHSLLAVRLLERLRRQGLQTDVRALFGHPTPARLAAAIGDQRAVVVPPNLIERGCEAITPAMLPLAALTQAEIDRIVGAVPGGAANVQDIYPLAPLQEGILFHHLMALEGDPYLLSYVLSFDLRERLDGFVAALQAVVARHDILRTSIAWEGSAEPMQVVWREAPLRVEDVRLDPAAGDVAEQLRARFDPRRFRLDVRHAPLMRGFAAHDAAGERWVLLLLAHHLALDHTTLEIAAEEARAHLMGKSALLPAATPFRDFVAQARLGVSREEHEAFFEAMLGDVKEVTAPFGLLDVRGDSSGVAEARLALDADLARRLRARARGLGVSAASLCHQAFAQLLARASGRSDVVFGTVLFGRMHGGVGTDRALGLFINTLPLRVRIGAEGIAASVRRMHGLLTALLRHEHASLSLAQRCSGVEAPAPLFSALLNYRHNPASSDAARHASAIVEGVTTLHAEERTNYPFTLSVDDLGEGFHLAVQTRGAIDPAQVCVYMRTTLKELVEALETAPETPARELEVLPPAERQKLLVEWNATAADYSRDKCLHGLFEAQAARSPEAVAVVFEKERLTYGELNARANRLAHRLVGLGVVAETIVGICAERCLEMVVGLLGVLKAGGAYLPLDPDYPSERLAYMIADARPALVLTQERLRERLPATIQTVCLDAHRTAIESDGNPVLRAAPHNLAYVIYTSGSTGKPKGVAVPHRGVVNRLEWMQARYELTESDTVLQKTPYGFDVSVWEFFWPLTVGARLALAPPNDHRDPRSLRAIIEREQVTTLHFVPSMLQTFLNVPDLPPLTTVRRVLCSGEELPAGLEEQFHLQQSSELHNLYGPTEASIDVTAYACRRDTAQTRIPIGRPIWNTQIYLLDADLEPAPMGVAGELYIGGVGLARGYLGRPDLTAERFVPNPFGEAGERLYRTGDSARYRANGNIEFLGRIDHQVKIRGFRIELGEIEAALSGLDEIREAVVVAREDAAGDMRLVAYVVWRDRAELSTAELRAALQRDLPDYMVPSAFVVLDALPLTTNGKADRKALPAPEARSARRYVAPRTPTEEALCHIWADVLGLERVGIEDNFFELGGHSLKALQSISRIWQNLGVSFPMSVFYEADTLSAVAESVEILRGLDAPERPEHAPSVELEEFEI
ncbi:non-ribosomal peptide synthetase [Methylosinus sporium]|nr:non-ribosomal peptide synthetase [Methylosinus sporium]